MKKIILLAAVLGFSAAISASAAEAKDNWANLCNKCHGDDGKGATKMGAKLGIKDLTDAKVQASFTDADAAKVIKDGKKSDDDRTLMKPFVTGADTPLSDDEVNALVKYVRGLKQ